MDFVKREYSTQTAESFLLTEGEAIGYRLERMDKRPSDDDMRKAAQILGRKGGKVSSARKAAAARRNGAKGGRPPSSRPAHE